MAEGAPATVATERAPCAVCGHLDWTLRFEKRGWRFMRCTGCGHVSLDPLPTPEDLARHHDASYRAGAYAAFASADDARTAVATARLRDVRTLAPPGPWLDVGCSTGAFAAAVAAAGLDVEGVEVSVAAAAAARGRGLVVHESPVERFTPTRRFAVVTAFDVVEHLPDPGAFLRRAHSWLPSNGVLVLTLPNAASATARLMGRHWFYYAAPDHVHYFTPPTITRLLRAAGFEPIHIRTVTKPLPLGYAAEQLRHFVPALGPLAVVLGALARTTLGTHPLPLPLGEMLVAARPATTP